MDIQIGLEFATSLLAACQVPERMSISPQCLIEPKFLTALSDFLGNILATWPSLPSQLQMVFQNAFDIKGWHLTNSARDIFGGDIANWIQSEINRSVTPQDDPATRLYGNLRKLSKPTTPMRRLMRQIYLVEFHHLRDVFHIHFTSPNREPLATYIGKRLSLEAEEVRSVCKYFALAGKRLDAVARELGGFGALLLPHDVARTRLERRIPLEGPEFDDVVRLLTEQGVHCNEGTQLYYDLAEQFFSRRHDEAIHLAGLLKTKSTHASSKTRSSKRISIETVDIESETAMTNGAGQSADGSLGLERAGLSTTQETTAHEDGARVTHQLNHNFNEESIVRANTACTQDRLPIEDHLSITLQHPALFSQDQGAVYNEGPMAQSNGQVLGDIDITDPIWGNMQAEISGFRSVMERPHFEYLGNGF